MNKHFIFILSANCAWLESTQLKNCPCYLGGGGGIQIYVGCVGMCNSCLQLQLLGHLGNFVYFLFFKKISLERKTRIYLILIFLLPHPPPLPLSGILYIVALETILSAVHTTVISTSSNFLF